MYKITVISSKLNAKRGSRYCFFKKTAKELIDLFIQTKCEFTIEKLGHVGDTFFWCDCDKDDKVFRYFEEKYNA